MKQLIRDYSPKYIKKQTANEKMGRRPKWRFHQRIHTKFSWGKKVMGETNKCFLMELYQVLPCDMKRAISHASC